MGKRRRWAALGATFALSVAACAAPEPPTERAQVPEQTAPVSVAPAATPTIPESLADASFVETSGSGTCAADGHAQIALLDPADGSERWAFPIPRPAEISVTNGSQAFIALAWDREQRPGIGAIDLQERTPLWQRAFANEAEQMKLVEDGLLVASHDDVRAIDPETGDDIWILDSQFDFESVVLTEAFVFAIDSVGVHAIDTATGTIVWQLEVLRPDSLAADDRTLVVAAGTRMIGVDIERRVRLWDINVDRRGSGDIAISHAAAVFELSTTVAPGGGVAAIDRNNGEELWRRTSIGDPVLAGTSQLVASTANEEPAPAAPFMLFGIDIATGVEAWRSASTAAAGDSVIGASDHRLVVREPHPVAPGMYRVRLIDLLDGAAIWETAIDGDVSGAAISTGDAVTLFGAQSARPYSDRGVVISRSPTGAWWKATQPEGIVQPPEATPHGSLVVSGERAPTCIGRAIRGPQDETAVLGTSVDG